MNKQKTLLVVSGVFSIIVLLALSVIPAFCGTTGIISGVITDSNSGEPLAGAAISVVGSQPALSDQNGFYALVNISPGEHTVTITADGYNLEEISQVSVLMDITTTVDIAMKPVIAAEENIIVTEKKAPIQKDAVPSMYVVDYKREAMTRTDPNNMYQIPGLVKTQPGIVTDSDGWPHIRGGRANQVGYMIEGIPVTEPVTNSFGTNSVTVGLDKMEIFTGGYLPEYGNAISGIFNQIIKTGKTYKGGSLQLLSGTKDFQGIYPEFGGALGDNGDYYASGYAWHSDFDGSSFNEVNSADMVGKLNYSLSDKDKLSFLSANGSAKYQFPTTHIQTLDANITDATVLIPIDEERDHNHQRYALNALTYTHSFTPSSFLSVKPYFFNTKWNFDALSDFSTGMGFWLKGQTSTSGLKLDYTNQFNQIHLVKAGFIGMASANSLRSAVPEMFEYDYAADTDTKQTGIYVQDQIKLNEKWGLDAGLRYDYIKYEPENTDDFNESQISPRLSLSYVMNPTTNLRFSYGKMIQFVQTQSIDRSFISPFWQMMYPNADRLRPERSIGYDLGIERQINKDYALLVTPFYRRFNDLLQTVSLDPSSPGDPPYIYQNLGVGTSSGVELLLRKRASKNWSGWLSYTYMTAKATASGTGLSSSDKIFVDWDQRHTATAVGNYMKNDWTYSLMAEYGSGLPFTLGEEDRNSSRVSSHLVFSTNISKRFDSGIFKNGELHIGIANIFNVRTALSKDEEGEPINRIPSRFCDLTYTMQF